MEFLTPKARPAALAQEERKVPAMSSDSLPNADSVNIRELETSPSLLHEIA